MSVERSTLFYRKNIISTTLWKKVIHRKTFSSFERSKISVSVDNDRKIFSEFLHFDYGDAELLLPDMKTVRQLWTFTHR